MRPESEGGAVRGRVVLGLLLWLTAVCGVAGLAWFAIDSAGKSVTALPLAPSAVSQGLTPTAEPTTEPDDPTTTVPVVPPASPKPTGLSTGMLRTTEDPAPSTSTATRTASPTRTSSRPTQQPSPSSPPRLYQTTKSGDWGSVTVGCRAGKVSLQNVSPGPDGWQMDIRSSGPPQVEVVFSPRKGKPVTVEGVCHDGRPEITTKDD